MGLGVGTGQLQVNARAVVPHAIPGDEAEVAAANRHVAPVILRRAIGADRAAAVLEEASKLRPELKMQSLELRQSAGLPARSLFSDCLAPIVWLGDDVELRRHRRVADLPQLDLEPEEVEGTRRRIIEPVKRRPVFLGEAARHPDDRYRFEASSVGEELPEVDVVGSFELVLNENVVVVDGVAAKNVGAERPD